LSALESEKSSLFGTNTELQQKISELENSIEEKQELADQLQNNKVSSVCS